ncbi:PQQ-binding-like beta-propeller repeat protein [Streptomyces sp. NPDC048512]|uniref:outer membrane protein assembly factor BamB family protein n=1 Tax=Streptomyces sp. NPDC048512 TaxID=3365563 RepID=UPI00372022E0
MNCSRSTTRTAASAGGRPYGFPPPCSPHPWPWSRRSSSPTRTAACGPWGAADGSTLWEAELGAPVVAPPLSIGDRLFIADTAGVVHCRSAATGEVLWCVEHAEGEEFFTLCTDGSAIYAGGWHGRLYLLDARDGSSLQSLDLGGQILATTYAPVGRTIYATASHGALHALPTSGAPEPAPRR